MTVRKRNIVLTIASALAITIGVVWWLLRWKAEEYAVDEAVIREAFSGEDVSYYVILDSTRPNGRTGIPGFHSEKLGVAPSARLSYTARNIFDSVYHQTSLFAFRILTNSSIKNHWTFSLGPADNHLPKLRNSWDSCEGAGG